ncbi:MAG: c-type cytochrome [Gammaproteobacteria bacterium]|nr:c-type cytochrome [Gammaproteobacteria bacterium]
MMRALKLSALAPAVLAAGLFASLAPAAEPAQQVSGEAVYKRWCTHCHSPGRGNPGTDSLQVKYGGKLPAVLLERSDLSPQAVAQFVRTGVLSMPPFRKTEVTDAELAAVSAYVAQKFPKP